MFTWKKEDNFCSKITQVNILQYLGYLNGSAAQKEEFRRMGIDYVRYCLESVAMWNTWLPKDMKDPNKPSAFSRGYQQLLRDGFQFP